MERLQTYHKERISIDLNESFYELPFYTKRKALKDLEVWSSSDSSFSFNNNQTKACKIFKKPC